MDSERPSGLSDEPNRPAWELLESLVPSVIRSLEILQLRIRDHDSKSFYTRLAFAINGWTALVEAAGLPDALYRSQIRVTPLRDPGASLDDGTARGDRARAPP